MSSRDDSITGDKNAIMCDTNVCACSTSANLLRVSFNRCTRECYAESGDQPPLQQLRTVIQIFDKHLSNHPILRHLIFT